jgi:hypothetical protein
VSLRVAEPFLHGTNDVVGSRAGLDWTDMPVVSADQS